MKKIKFLISLCTIIAVLITSCCFTVCAAECKTSISISASDATVGDTVTITIRFTGVNTLIESAMATVGYDSTVLSYQESGNYASDKGNGKIGIVKSSEATKTISFPITFKVIAEGTCKISVADALFVAENGDIEENATPSS